VKTIGGVFLILLGVAAFFYIEVVWVWVGGIEEVTRGFNSHPVSGHDLGWGFVRFLGPGEIVSILAAAALIVPGVILLGKQEAAKARLRRKRNDPRYINAG
jgi:hypothetical protein